ncbi:MAG: antibiotic biosynthesis monooxygenase [Acidobacteriota bacterium]
MTIMVKVEAVAQPEKTTELVRMLQRGFPHTRAAPGCHDLTAYLNEDGVSLVVIEHWESKAHYQSYLDWRTETGAIDALGALLQGPLEIRFFEKVGA